MKQRGAVANPSAPLAQGTRIECGAPHPLWSTALAHGRSVDAPRPVWHAGPSKAAPNVLLQIVFRHRNAILRLLGSIEAFDTAAMGAFGAARIRVQAVQLVTRMTPPVCVGGCITQTLPDLARHGFALNSHIYSLLAIVLLSPLHPHHDNIAHVHQHSSYDGPVKYVELRLSAGLNPFRKLTRPPDAELERMKTVLFTALCTCTPPLLCPAGTALPPC